MKKWIIIALLGLVLAGCSSVTGDAPKNNAQHANEAQAVVLANTETVTFHSKSIDQVYKFQVSLPGSYASSEERDYPVIYVIDGQWNFLLAAGLYGSIAHDGQMPEAIIAAISWENVGDDIHKPRARDLLGTPIEAYPESGQASQFLSALERELIPFFESRYRASGHRTVLGGSWGGSFATYAMLENPEVFDGYIAIAGPYAIDHAHLVKRLKESAGTDRLAKERLYIGIGSLDFTKAQVDALVEEVKRAELPGLAFEFEVIEGYGHSGINIPGYARGYQHVFQRPRLNLAKNVLARYEGEYRREGTPQRLRVSAGEGGLLIEEEGGDRALAYAQSDSEFYIDGLNLHYAFSRTEDGRMKMAVTAWGDTIEFLRTSSLGD